MRVEELIEYLRDCDQDTEVRFASQPSWPFEYSINSVVEVEVENRTGESEKVIFLEEGRQLGYLHRAVKDELMW